MERMEPRVYLSTLSRLFVFKSAYSLHALPVRITLSQLALNQHPR